MAKTLLYSGPTESRPDFPKRYRGKAGEVLAGGTLEVADDAEADRLVRDFAPAFKVVKSTPPAKQ